MSGWPALTLPQWWKSSSIWTSRDWQHSNGCYLGLLDPKRSFSTTPNREYNVKWETLPAGKFRHRDHRFEWTRAEFHAWANGICRQYGYAIRFVPIGPEDAVLGAPTQLGLFQMNSTPTLS
jgi:hypothetical protein